MTQATITIHADTRPAQAALLQLNRVIAAMGSNAFGGLNSQLAALIAQLQAAQNGLNNTGRGARGAAGGFGALAGSIGKTIAMTAGLTVLTAGIAGLASTFTDAADGAALLNGRLSTVTNSAQELANANEAVRQIAAATRSDLLATGTLYASLARNAELLGATQAEVGEATKIFAMSLKLSGADANTAASAIRQLGQAIGSNRLGGDEFASIAEANPEFMNALAASMKVARGELKGLAAEGKITGKEIKDALTDPAIVEYFEGQFGKIPVTFADIRTAVGNMMVDVAGAIKKGLGIEDSLAVLVAKINAFAKSSLPTFENIGRALREAFNGIAPVVSTVFGALGSVLGVIINNMGLLVGLTKAAVAGWLAFKAAGAISTVLAMTQQVIALNMALGASGPVSALFAAGMKLVQGAIRGVTAALLANPFTALAVAITGIIALLYEFSDKIKIGGGSIASLSSLVKSFAEMVGPMFSAIGDTVSSVFTGIGEIASSVFGSLWGYVAPFFENFDFSLAGMLRFAAKILDTLVSVFNFAVAAMKQSFAVLPSFIVFGFATAFNAAAGLIEKFANGAIGAINLLIGAANAMGASFDKINPVKLERMAAAMPKFKGAGELWAGSKSNAASAFVEGRIARANEIERASGAGDDKKDSLNKKLKIANGGGTDGDDAAKKAADAKKKLEEIQAKYDEFFISMTEQAKLAGMLPVEAERYNKELELRKILGDGDLKNARELSELEKTKIADLLAQKALGEIMRDMKIAERDAAFESSRLEEQKRILASGTLEQVAANLAVEDKLAKFKKAAMDAGISLENEQFKAALATLSVRERENYLLSERNRLQREGLEKAVGYAQDAVRTDGTSEDRRRLANSELFDTQKWLEDALAANRITLGEYNAGMRRANREHSEAVQAIAGEFYDKMSDGISRLAGLFSGKLGKVFDALDGVIRSLKAIDKDGKLGDALKGLFGEEFMKGIGEQFGKALDGAELGSQIANLANAIGIKGFDKTGSQIGGAIGSFVPIPGGQIIGSIIGGIIGGLFKKAPRAAAVITDGNVSVTGNKASARDSVTTAAGSINDGLQALADRLGGTLGSYAVSIGKHNDHYRVSGIATTRVGDKHPNTPLLYNGTDEAEAIRIALQDAIRDGAIKGISDFAQKALNKLDIDGAVSLIDAFNEITKSLDAMRDPIGSAVRDINTSLDALVKRMQNVGASSEDLAKVEEYRSKKLAEAYSNGIKSLTEFQEKLNGEGSGVTDLTRLNTALGKFDAFKADIAAGKQIDQGAFTALGADIMQLAQGIYGTSTSQFQDIRSMLTDATQGALDVYQASYDDATTRAIEAQTEAMTNQQAITNDLLRQQLELSQRQMEMSEGNNNRSAFVNAIMGDPRAAYL